MSAMAALTDDHVNGDVVVLVLALAMARRLL